MIMVCRSLASLARCTHRDVGAIIAIEYHGNVRIVGHGYNRGPKDKPTCIEGGCPRGTLPPGQGQPDYSDCITVHAEMAAMLMAGSALCGGATLYVNSEPCFMCYRVAKSVGIARVVWQSDGEHVGHERQF
jgi:dCMP deaminase